MEQLAEEQGQPLMENGPIFEWSPGDLIVDVNDDAEGMHEEMDEVEYPPDDNGNDEGHDFGAALLHAGGPKIITNEEDVEDIDEDRSVDNEEYEGDWTNKMDQEDGPDKSEEDYESRSKSQNSDAQGAQRDGEHKKHPDSEVSDEEEPQNDDASVEENVTADSKGKTLDQGEPMQELV